MLSKEDFMSKLKEARELAIIQRGLLEDIFGDYTFEHIPFEAQKCGKPRRGSSMLCELW